MKKVLIFIAGAVIGLVSPILVANVFLKVYCWQPYLAIYLQLLLAGISALICLLLRKRKALLIGAIIFIIPATLVATTGWSRTACSPGLRDAAVFEPVVPERSMAHPPAPAQ